MPDRRRCTSKCALAYVCPLKVGEFILNAVAQSSNSTSNVVAVADDNAVAEVVVT